MSGITRNPCAAFALVILIACSAKDDASPEALGEGAMPGMKMEAGRGAESVTLTAAQIRSGGVRWEPAIAASVASTVEVPAQLTPNEDRTAQMGAPASGRVVSVSVRPGDAVRGGALLVTLQSAEAGMAQADVAKATAEVSSRRAAAVYARTARERADRLLAVKAIARQDYERALADDELARAALAQANADLTRARTGAAQLGVGARGGAMEIRAPFAGVVIGRQAVPGSVVSSGTPLVSLSDLSTLWLTLDVPAQLAGGIRANGPVSFTVSALPAETFSARVISVSGSLDVASRTLPVRALVPNASRRLRPGMLATARVEGGGVATAASVPDAALLRMGPQTVVFVARSDGRGGAQFEARPVELGARSGGRTAVLGGVSPGELVVVGGAFAVKGQLEKAKMPAMEM